MTSSLEEKTKKTLEALGVRDAAGLESLFAEAQNQLEAERSSLVENPPADTAEREAVIKALRDRWLARKNGLVTFINENWLRKAPGSLKPAAGRCFNELRKQGTTIETEVLRKEVPVRKMAGPASAEESLKKLREAQRNKQFAIAAQAGLSAADPILPSDAQSGLLAMDPTLPGRRRTLGSLHPVTRVQREIEDIFISLGFSIETGPEIETAYYNFEALNIPETHPARDDQDTLYVNAETVLRTHTSPVQIRAMERIKEPPLYIIVPGKVYRRDNPDATHSPMFHQIEGLAIDRDINFADLKGVLDYFIKRFFGEKVRTSFHPSFFPFTEPSAEVAISCVFCDGKGCRVCKQSGWIEVMGCGMVHPNVLRAGGIDPKKYSGWAFGLGVDRYAMFKYDINDIQLFYQSDIRFLEQFP